MGAENCARNAGFASDSRRADRPRSTLQRSAVSAVLKRAVELEMGAVKAGRYVVSRRIANLARCLVAGLVAAAPSIASAASDPQVHWLGFAENYGEDIRLSVQIDSTEPVSGSVEIPGLAFSARFTSSASATTTIDLPIEAMARPGKPMPIAVQVRADGDIVVRGLNHRPSSSDAFLALPQAMLGREYRGLGYTQLRPDQPSQLLVVATADGTRVTVEAQGDCPAADQRLRQGEVWLYTCSDVSGLHVQASQPVAVFGGARCAEVPLGQPFCSHLAEQVPPVTAWGQRFAVLPLATRKGADRIRIVSHDDATEVRVDGAPAITLAAGQVHQFTLSRPLLIDADKPVLVAQFAAGAEADGAVGDPFMALVPALTQFAARQIVTAPSPVNEETAAFASHHVNLVLPADAVASFRLDGAPVAAESFMPIGDGRLSGAVLPLDPGRHELLADAPFGAIVYGFGDTDGYGLPGAWPVGPAVAEADAARAGDNSAAPTQAPPPR